MFFDDARITFYFGTFELRMEINVSLLFVIVMHFLLRHNHVIYLFDVVSLFDDVRITLYLGTFELRTEIAL